MNGRIARLLAILLVAGLAAGGAYVVWQKTRPPKLPEGFLSGNGRIEGTEIDIATKFAGRIDAVFVKEGDLVTAGQLLVRMDARALSAQLNYANASLIRAKRDLDAARAEVERRTYDRDLARTELKRSETLVDQGYATRQRYDRDRATAQMAEAGLAQSRAQVNQSFAAISAAEAQVNELEANLADSKIAAPTGGRVLFRLAEPGEVLAAGGKVLTIVDLSDLYMTLYIPERVAGKIPIGAEGRIRVDARPELLIPGRVSFVASEAEFTPKEVQTTEERQKLVFRVKLRPTENPDGLLKPGMPGVGFIRYDAAIQWPESLP